MIRTNLDSVPNRALTFWLPSKGIPYKVKFPTIEDKIEIRPYTLESEAILMGNRTTHEKMALITSKVVSLPEKMNVNDLLVADQFVILAIARALTYGESYKFFATCPSCAHREECVCKVPDDLPVRLWDPEKIDTEIVLPVTKDVIGLRFLTVKDDGEIDRYEKQMVAATRGSNQDASAMAYLRRLAYHVKSVNNGDVESVDEAQQYIIRLYGEDVAAFKAGIEDKSCGIMYEWPLCCDSCQHIYSTQFPITADFFRRNRQ